MQNQYSKRAEAFQKSLETLKLSKTADKSNPLILSGIVMSFNLTFDLAWKLIKDILQEDHGIKDFPSGSPKETLKKAKSVGIIQDEIWLDMLDDRNDLIHDYDFVFASKKVDTIINNYIPEFEKMNI